MRWLEGLKGIRCRLAKEDAHCREVGCDPLNAHHYGRGSGRRTHFGNLSRSLSFQNFPVEVRGTASMNS